MKKPEIPDVLVPGGSRAVDLVESWIFMTSSRYNFSIYSERLILRLIQIAQSQVLGANFKDGTDIGRISVGRLGHVTIEIPIRSLLSEGDTNYVQARSAVQELMHSPWFVETPKLSRDGTPVLDSKGRQEYEFRGSQILNNVDINVKPGTAVVEVNRNTWAAILDFSKGFRRYDLATALKLKLSSSLRMFKLLSNQSEPITFSLEMWRRMWGMDRREGDVLDREGRVVRSGGEYVLYRDNSTFIKRAILPARDELDRKAAWTFDYKLVKEGKKIVGVTFFPIRRLDNLSQANLIRLSSSAFPVSGTIGRSAVEKLKNKLDFDDQGLKNNIRLFAAVHELRVDIDAFIDRVVPSAVRAPSPQGYFIKSLKNYLREKHGVEFDEAGNVVRTPGVLPFGED